MLFRAIRRAFNAGRKAFGGRLCHFSVQRDHLHLVVEAANREALSRALQALAIRIARAINRVLGRKGKVFADRYDCSSLAWLDSAVVVPRTWPLRSAERALQLRRGVR
jgi:REP element-mobilizing transposase RayT